MQCVHNVNYITPTVELETRVSDLGSVLLNLIQGLNLLWFTLQVKKKKKKIGNVI